MPHYKKFFPTGFIDESDLPNDVVVTIKAVGLEDLQLPGTSATEKKLVMSFEGAKKKLVVNKTNAQRIAKLYGGQTEDWIGKQITLYFDPEVKFGKQVVGGVRVRKEAPGK